MPPKPRVEWSNVLTGLMIAAVTAGVTVYSTGRDTMTTLQAQASFMPDRRDRELDTLERRVAALESRCD